MRKLASQLSKAHKQANRAAKNLERIGESRHKADKNDGYTRSYGTSNAHRDVFKQVSNWVQDQPDIRRFNALTDKQAERFLQEKSVDVCNKTIACYAVALEHHLRHNCGHGEVKLHRPPSAIPEIIASRAYTKEAIDLLKTQQTERSALSTRLCEEGGLRAHELLTIKRVDEQPKSVRSGVKAWRDDRFAGRESWVTYTVTGKGGLVREVRFSPETAADLERYRVDPLHRIDRGIKYVTVYNLQGGKSFSNAWSQLSKEQLGHSHGAHGIRHTYAQLRMRELGRIGKTYDESKLIVSQELGHFRPSITDLYLR